MTYTLNLKAFTDSIGDRALKQLCRENPDLRFETDKSGKLIVMSPTGSETGKRNGDLFGQIWYWNYQTKLGVVFDSSTGFRLFNGAIRSPDVSWIENFRWNSLSDEQKRGFAPIDPDLAIELIASSRFAVPKERRWTPVHSPTDSLTETQQKMQEYMDCGVKLGWLINPDGREVALKD